MWKRIFSKSKEQPIKTLVNPKEKYSLPLIEKEDVSYDTKRFRFALPSKQHVLGMM
jgi:cytochrome-b5 reductase